MGPPKFLAELIVHLRRLVERSGKQRLGVRIIRPQGERPDRPFGVGHSFTERAWVAAGLVGGGSSTRPWGAAAIGPATAVHRTREPGWGVGAASLCGHRGAPSRIAHLRSRSPDSRAAASGGEHGPSGAAPQGQERKPPGSGRGSNPALRGDSPLAVLAQHDRVWRTARARPRADPLLRGRSSGRSRGRRCPESPGSVPSCPGIRRATGVGR